MSVQLSPKSCPICRSSYVQFSSLRAGCSIECRAEIKRQKERAKAAKLARRETRDKLVKLRTARDWMKLAQKEFNAFVRWRDRFLPCISCSKPANAAVKWNAGHYRPAGVNSALRFDEANCHKQDEACNSYRSGNLTIYRANLIAKIGLAEVTRLDDNHEVRRWTIPELIEIRDRYKQKVKELKGGPSSD